jgi:hypothetical protein
LIQQFSDRVETRRSEIGHFFGVLCQISTHCVDNWPTFVACAVLHAPDDSRIVVRAGAVEFSREPNAVGAIKTDYSQPQRPISAGATPGISSNANAGDNTVITGSNV